MYSRPDILIRTAHERPLAFVEVKNLPQLSAAEAIALRDTILEQQGPRSGRYVLVLSQTRGFLWRREGDRESYGEPDEFDMAPVLREYLGDAEVNRHLRGADLELVFSYWLGDLARGRMIRPLGVADHGPFVQFLQDIRGAHVNLEAAA